MTLTFETYERIWRETNDECSRCDKRHMNRWNDIYERKVREELAKVKERR